MEPVVSTFASDESIYDNCPVDDALSFGTRRVAPAPHRQHLSFDGIYELPDQQPVYERMCQPVQPLALPLLPLPETASSDNRRSCQVSNSSCLIDDVFGFGSQEVVLVAHRHHLSSDELYPLPDQQSVYEPVYQPVQQRAFPLLPVTETACSDDGHSCQPHGEAVPLQVCRSGNPEALRRLLTADPGIARQWFRSQMTGCDVTLLHIAAGNGHKQILQALLEAGADCHATCKDMTALFLAVSKGHEACWQALLSAGADPNTPRKTGVTPLFCAALRGDQKAVEALVNAGANTHLTFMGGLTVLHMAVLQDDQVSVAKKLLMAGADCNAIDDMGETPLLIAIREGSVRCAQLLINNGASLNVACKDGTTPLYLAVKKDCVEIVQELLRAGAAADPVPLWDGTMPLHIAVLNGNKRITQALINSGADPDVVDAVGITPLYIAARECHYQCLKVLLSAGANTEIACFLDGATPLSVAAQNRELRSVQKLLNAGAKKKCPVQ